MERGRVFYMVQSLMIYSEFFFRPPKLFLFILFVFFTREGEGVGPTPDDFALEAL